MKNYFFTLSLLLCLSACNKTVDAIKEDLVVKAMTDGQWKVTKFSTAGTDNTAEFLPYKFQFLKNNTVQAINNGSIENTGGWTADAAARTISSAFSGATPVISRLNGTWQITNNSWTFVEATQTVNNEVRTLRLDK